MEPYETGDPGSLSRAGDRSAGRHWTREEVELVVADYFAMFESEIAGRSYNKTSHRKILEKILFRSSNSIEFKHCNTSAVLSELGLPWIPGYQTLHHYQRLLVEEVEHYLDRLGEIAGQSPRKTRPQAEPAKIFVDAPQKRAIEARPWSG